MQWVIIMATTTLAPIPPHVCQSIGMNVQAVIQAHIPAPIAVRLKCELRPIAGPPVVPIPESALPPPPAGEVEG